MHQTPFAQYGSVRWRKSAEQSGAPDSSAPISARHRRLRLNVADTESQNLRSRADWQQETVLSIRPSMQKVSMGGANFHIRRKEVFRCELNVVIQRGKYSVG
jgi:hypothetical protein